MVYMFLKLRDNKGVALMTVFLVMVVLSLYAVGYISVSINQKNTVEIFNNRAKALNLAEAGLDHALYWLRAQPSPPVGNYTNPWGGIQNLGAGTYNVTITDLGAIGGSPNIRRYKATSTGLVGGRSRVLTNYLQVDNFARYIWFTDSETFSGMNVWFWTQDRLDGETCTNTHFNIFRSPVFEGKVGQVDNYIRYYNNGHNINLVETTSNAPYDTPDFQQGVDFGQELTVMPAQASSLRVAATAGGLALSGNSTVVLKSNGTMDVTNSAKGWNNHNMALPGNGALFVTNGNLIISGTLNGRLTVGSNRDVVVPSNLIYADDPRVNPNSDDVLGIISERNALIDDVAPMNVEVDGVIMALNTSFMRENYASGPPKGTLTVYGGIIQDQRGPVGTFNGATGQKLSGYSKDYSYDPRLLSSPPPYMPTTGDYVTLSWEED